MRSSFRIARTVKVWIAAFITSCARGALYLWRVRHEQPTSRRRRWSMAREPRLPVHAPVACAQHAAKARPVHVDALEALGLSRQLPGKLVGGEDGPRGTSKQPAPRHPDSRTSAQKLILSAQLVASSLRGRFAMQSSGSEDHSGKALTTCNTNPSTASARACSKTGSSCRPTSPAKGIPSVGRA